MAVTPAETSSTASRSSPRPHPYRSRACLANLAFELKELIALHVQARKPELPVEAEDRWQYSQHDTFTDRDLRSLAGTCRDFREIGRGLLWHTLIVVLHEEKSVARLKEILPNGRSFNTLFLAFTGPQGSWGIDCNPDSPIPWFMAAIDLIRLCPGLKRCRISDLPGNPEHAMLMESVGKALFESSRDLSAIDISSHRWDKLQQHHILSLIQNLHLLQIISFSGVVAEDGSQGLANHLATLEHLKSLELSVQSSFCDSLAKARFRNSIQSVRLNRFTFTSSRTLHSFISSLASSIVWLDICGDQAHNFDDFGSPYHLPNLRVLTLRDNAPITLFYAFAPCVSLAVARFVNMEFDFLSEIETWDKSRVPPSIRFVIVQHYKDAVWDNVHKDDMFGGLEDKGIHFQFDWEPDFPHNSYMDNYDDEYDSEEEDIYEYDDLDLQVDSDFDFDF